MACCEHWGRLISLNIDGKLNGSDRQMVEEHLSTCAVCADTHTRLQFLRRTVMELPEPEIPAEVAEDLVHAGRLRKEAEKRRRRRFAGLLGGAAAAAIFVIALAVTILGPFWIKPQVTYTVPSSGAEVKPGDHVELVFNKTMDVDSVKGALNIAVQKKPEDRENARKVKIAESRVDHESSYEQTVPYALSWQGKTLVITFPEGLPPGSEYTIQLSQTAKDRWGHYLAEPFSLRFVNSANH